MATDDQLARLRAEITATDRARINPDDASHIRALKRVVPHGARDPLREALTAAARPRAQRKLAEIAGRPGPLRINLGSGHVPIEGWVNLDLAGAPVDVPWNLK